MQGRLSVTVILMVLLAKSYAFPSIRFGLRERTPEQLEALYRIPEWHAQRVSGHRSAPILSKGIDNTCHRFFPSVFSQRGGSCSQAAAIRYVYTYEYNRMKGTEAVGKENIFSYMFTWNYLNEGIGEGSQPELGYDIMKTAGVPTLSGMDDDDDTSVSTTTWLSGYDKYVEAMKHRVKSYYRFNLKTREGIDDLRQYLYNHGEEGASGGVVTFSCNADNWGMAVYGGPSVTGLHDIIVKNGTKGGHCVTIAGYDDTVEYDLNRDGVVQDDERGAFIMVNSWGAWFGSNGKCYYPYKLFLMHFREGGLYDEYAQGLAVEPEAHQPLVVFHVNLTYDSRDDLFFVLGVSDDDENGWGFSFDLVYPLMFNQGGDLPLCGDGGNVSCNTIDVGLNFTDYLPLFKDFKKPRFSLHIHRLDVGKTRGMGKVNYFSVLDYRKGVEYRCSHADVPLNTSEVRLDATTPIAISGVSDVFYKDSEKVTYDLNGVRTTGSHAGFNILQTCRNRYLKILK